MLRLNGEFFDESLIAAIRDHFANVESDPYSGQRIYFENAGGSLTLKSVVDVVAQLTALPDNAARDNPASKEIGRLIAQGKQDVRTFLGASAGIVAMGESTTSLAFRIISAILGNTSGDNVVTTNLDHPSVYDATRIHAQKCGKQWRVAGLNPKKGIVEVEEILKHIDSNTALLAVVHSSNNLGTRNDVASIIREARKVKPDIYVLVDGSQHVPHYCVDVDALDCDAYVFSTYKTFSKIGAAFAYLSDRASLFPHDRLAGSAETNWELGTREQAGYAAWSQVLDYIRWLGGSFTDSQDRRTLVTAAMNAIESHERALTYCLLHGSERATGLLDIDGVTVYGEIDDLTLREPVVALNRSGIAAGELASRLEEKGIRVTVRVADFYSKHTLHAMGLEECVRVSLDHYNTVQEIDVFLRAMQEVTA